MFDAVGLAKRESALAIRLDKLKKRKIDVDDFPTDLQIATFEDYITSDRARPRLSLRSVLLRVKPARVAFQARPSASVPLFHHLSRRRVHITDPGVARETFDEVRDLAGRSLSQEYSRILGFLDDADGWNSRRALKIISDSIELVRKSTLQEFCANSADPPEARRVVAFLALTPNAKSIPWSSLYPLERRICKRMLRLWERALCDMTIVCAMLQRLIAIRKLCVQRLVALQRVVLERKLPCKSSLRYVLLSEAILAKIDGATTFLDSEDATLISAPLDLINSVIQAATGHALRVSRKSELLVELRAWGITKMRSDSRFCSDYIEGATNRSARDVAAIVELTRRQFEYGHLTYSQCHDHVEAVYYKEVRKGAFSRDAVETASRCI